jgi:hypothetical protein
MVLAYFALIDENGSATSNAPADSIGLIGANDTSNHRNPSAEPSSILTYRVDSSSLGKISQRGIR